MKLFLNDEAPQTKSPDVGVEKEMSQAPKVRGSIRKNVVHLCLGMRHDGYDRRGIPVFTADQRPLVRVRHCTSLEQNLSIRIVGEVWRINLWWRWISHTSNRKTAISSLP